MKLLPRVIWSATLLSSPLLWAQDPPAPAENVTPAPVVAPAPPAPATTEKVYDLQPFVIVADEEESGYVVTNTLAGNRISTELKDIGAAVSIYNQQLLQDIDAQKIEEILTYTTSTEGGGIGGNYAGFSGLAADGAREDPSGVIRVRSLAPAMRTRDYFPTDIPGDSFNFSTVTISRGPNAILAGIGPAGGVVDSAMRIANFRNGGSVSFRVGSEGSHRQEFHANVVAIEDVLAFRLDAKAEEQKFAQNPAYSDDHRLYFATQWRLRRASRQDFWGNTTLRANLEVGSISGIPPNSLPPVFSVQSWYEGIDPRNDQPFTSPGWYYNGATRETFNAAGSVIPANQTIAGFPLYRQWALIFADPSSGTAGVGFTDPSLAAIQGYQGTIPAGAGSPLGALRGTGDRNRERAGFSRTLLFDRNVFDFYEELLTGALDYRAQGFDAVDVRLEQLFAGGRAGVELAYNRQNFGTSRDFPISGNDAEIFIDVNRYLSVRNDAFGTGAPVAAQLIENPNFGRPYIVSRDAFRDQANKSEREAMQATAFFRHNFALSDSRILRMLGNHTISAFAFQTDILKQNRTYISTWDPQGELNVLGSLGAGPGLFATQVNAFYYIGPSLVGTQSESEIRLNPIASARPQFGDTYTVRAWDTVQRRFVTGTSTPLRVLGTARDELEEIQSAAISWQGTWLDDHVVTMLGWRRDSSNSFTSFDPPRLPDGNLDLSNFALVEAATREKDSWTKSVVLRAPRQLMERLPGNATMRVYWNESENFTPVGQRRNQFNEEIGPPVGSTREYGLGLTLFRGRLDLRINRFRTEVSALNVPGVGNAYTYTNTAINRMLEARNLGLLPADYGYDDPSFVTFEDVARAFYETIPDRLKARIGPEFNFHPRFIDNNGVLGWEPDSIVSKVSASDAIAKGTEIELTVNPSRSFRVMFSVAQNEALRANVAAEEQEYIRLWRTNLETLYGGSLLRGDRSPGAAPGQTIWPQYSNEIIYPTNVAAALSGTANPEVRKWRAALITRYEIRQGRFRGASAGVNVRWQDKVAIGYPLIRDENNQQIADIANPYFGEDTVQVDFNVGYKRTLRFGGRRHDWRIGLNIRNLFADDEMIPVSANADGSIGVARIPPPRTWNLSTGISF